MNYEPHIDRQNTVYAEFRDATASLQELAPDPCIASPRAGYIVAFRHAATIMEPFSEFTRALCEVVPSLPFDTANGHTTITVHGKQPQETFEASPVMLEDLRWATAQIDPRVWLEVRIDFREWYFGRESVIVAGIPNEAFWEVGHQLKAAGAQRGLELRMPWGAHMTAARFTEDCSADTVNSLRRALREAPVLGVSVPSAIEVGCYASGPAGFFLHPVEGFSDRPS